MLSKKRFHIRQRARRSASKHPHDFRPNTDLPKDRHHSAPHFRNTRVFPLRAHFPPISRSFPPAQRLPALATIAREQRRRQSPRPPPAAAAPARTAHAALPRPPPPCPATADLASLTRGGGAFASRRGGRLVSLGTKRSRSCEPPPAARGRGKGPGPSAQGSVRLLVWPTRGRRRRTRAPSRSRSRYQ